MVVKYFTIQFSNTLIMKIDDLNKIDGKRMFETYDKWPNIAKSVFESESER